jgi:hypothetical protein
MIRSRIRELKCDRVFFTSAAAIEDSGAAQQRLKAFLLGELESAEFIASAKENGTPLRVSEYRRAGLTGYAKSFTNIYLVICKTTGAIKIGRADDVRKRLSTLQISNPGELAVLACFRAPAVFEGVLHAMFSSSRVRGEWFSLTDDLLDLAETANDKNYLGVLRYSLELADRKWPLTI